MNSRLNNVCTTRCLSNTFDFVQICFGINLKFSSTLANIRNLNLIFTIIISLGKFNRCICTNLIECLNFDVFVISISSGWFCKSQYFFLVTNLASSNVQVNFCCAFCQIFVSIVDNDIINDFTKCITRFVGCLISYFSVTFCLKFNFSRFIWFCFNCCNSTSRTTITSYNLNLIVIFAFECIEVVSCICCRNCNLNRFCFANFF